MEPNTIARIAIPDLPEAALERIQRRIRTCQHLLATPSASAILACGTCMGEVQVELESVTGTLRDAPPETRDRLRERVSAIAGEFRHARRLLDSAATLYKGWAHVLAS